jgi:hypothetical protein
MAVPAIGGDCARRSIDVVQLFRGGRLLGLNCPRSEELIRSPIIGGHMQIAAGIDCGCVLDRALADVGLILLSAAATIVYAYYQRGHAHTCRTTRSTAEFDCASRAPMMGKVLRYCAFTASGALASATDYDLCQECKSGPRRDSRRSEFRAQGRAKIERAPGISLSALCPNPCPNQPTSADSSRPIARKTVWYLPWAQRFESRPLR